VQASRNRVQVRKFTPIIKAIREAKYLARDKRATRQGKKLVINPKRERAKSKVVEEIKAVLEFEHKIVVMSSYFG